MGYAPCAWEETIGEDISLLYMDITWAELEPEEGKYDWEKIERENQTDRWREEGKHLVLRFVCDIPGEEKHMDIPQWLYDKTDHAGTWYDMEYGKGYAPDYNNEQMIQYHKGQLMHLESILAEMDWSVISNLEVWGTGENGM